MDREFLEDYGAKEEEEFNKFLKKFQDTDKKIRYPDNKKFKKLKDPVGVSGTIGKSIWSQMPLFGSYILPVHPIQEEFFYSQFGIEKRNFDQLIDFCKDTGKVQFALNGSWKSYVDLDFLSPLFEEIRPPFLRVLPANFLIEEKELKSLATEFDTLIDIPDQKGISYRKFLQLTTAQVPSTFGWEEIVNENFRYYAFLKGYGYDKLVEDLESLFLFDSRKAFNFLADVGRLVIDTLTSTLNADPVFSWEDLSSPYLSGTSNSHTEKKHQVNEIGVFLLNEITYMPESFEACKDVIARYDQEDLNKVYASLHNSVENSDIELVSDKKTELSEILKNVWEDSTVEKRIKGVKYGIPISMALVGTLAAGPAVGAGAGLLSGLGFKVASDIVGLDQDAIGEKLAKKTTPNHIVNIFDFKKKYNL